MTKMTKMIEKFLSQEIASLKAAKDCFETENLEKAKLFCLVANRNRMKRQLLLNKIKF